MLLPAGAFAVHQLRYWLTYGSQANTQLADQGHAYLGSLVPWIVLATAAAFGSFVVRVALASRTCRTGGRARPFAATWATTAVALVALYSLQESLEGVLVQGHPGGFAGVFGHGGWWSLPAAAAIALAIATLLRAADTIVHLVARVRRPQLVFEALLHLRPISVVLVARRPRAATAGRAPPRVCLT